VIIPEATLASLLPDYDVYLVDQFGTLHDGERPYIGAVSALRMLRAAGKRVVLLSNSGRRVGPNAERLHRIGIPPNGYDELMTSGEIGWRMLRDHELAVASGARSCLLLARGGDTSPVDGVGLSLASPAENADLVVIAGSDGDHVPLAQYREWLRPAALGGVPCLCLNPDRTMLTNSGPAFGAGVIAELYQKLGGAVVWIGKPYPEIYQATLADADRTRVIGIGDSIEHDIAGATHAGCASVLVRTGISEGASDAEIAAECARHGAWPTFTMSAFLQSHRFTRRCQANLRGHSAGPERLRTDIVGPGCAPTFNPSRNS
jgi:HAD superfamily hydrolase (TIGR01459 family)